MIIIMKNKKEKADAAWLAVKIIWKTAPQKCILELLLACFKNILTLANAVWLLHFIMDRIEDADSFPALVSVLGIMAVLNGLFCALDNWYRGCYKPAKDLETKNKLAQRMMDKAKHLPLRDYENAEFYSIVTRAHKGAELSVFQLFDNVVQMAGFLAGLFSAAVVMIRLDPLLLLFGFFAPPMLLAAKKHRAALSEKNKECVKSQRLKAYALNTWLVKEYAREFRTSDACRIPDRLYDNAYAESLAIHRKHRNRLFWLDILNRGFSVNLISIVCYSYAFIRICFFHNFSISVFAVLFMAIMNVLSKINRIAKSYAKLGNYESDVRAVRLFLELEEEEEPKQPLIPGKFESLEFKNVSFSYDGNCVLQNVSFQLQAGGKYAIAGYNGAGKTTLAKLILRFYDVSEGEILYNGCNIKQYDLESYRNKIAAVFQDFHLFYLKLSENVFLEEDTFSEKDVINSRLSAVLKELKAEELYQDKDRFLGRDYDSEGIVLSGGQKQKLAVARALCRDAEITIMDEPSAALDPISASRVMDCIIGKCEGKTLIMISHQMSAVKNMDKILMFEKGRLTGFGTHEELLADNSAYADFYSCQADIYSDSGQIKYPATEQRDI